MAEHSQIYLKQKERINGQITNQIDEFVWNQLNDLPTNRLNRFIRNLLKFSLFLLKYAREVRTSNWKAANGIADRFFDDHEAHGMSLSIDFKEDIFCF